MHPGQASDLCLDIQYSKSDNSNTLAAAVNELLCRIGLASVKTIRGFLIAAVLAILPAPLIVAEAADFVVDTSTNAPITALWWNENESGWGVTLTQQVDIIFVTMFTYDTNGFPHWYVASDCAVQADGCTGILYEITGGAAPTDAWENINLNLVEVGTITFAFTSNDAGSVEFEINGISGTKDITRQIWAIDADGDGVSTRSDAFPDDPTETRDSDDDGVGDNSDNCPTDANSDQADSDGNTIGDACEPAPGVPSFAEVQAIFDANCVLCHGSNGGLTLSSSVSFSNLVNVPSQGVPSVVRVSPGSSDNSYLIWKLEGRSGIVGDRMPRGGVLPDSDIALIAAWIDAGANP